jgi:hypothetical protein
LEQQDLAAGARGAEVRGHLDAVPPRHVDVDQRDVGSEAHGGLHHEIAPVHPAEHLEVRLDAEQGCEGLGHEVHVLGDEDAQRRGHDPCSRAAGT